MSKLRRLATVLALVLPLLLAPAASQAAPVLYGITFTNQLITIDTGTGLGTLVGAVDPGMGAFGLAAFGGKLYTFDQTGDLLKELDPATGATLSSVAFGVDLVGEGGMDFRSDGTGFLNSSAGANGKLYTFTTAANSGTLVGAINGAASNSLDGLAFNSSDVLYALSQTTQNLYTVNQATAALTLIGATGVADSNTLGGLDFLDDNTLYAVMNDTLYQLNVGTGAATLIGRIGFAQVSGLAFLDGAPAVPEPATLLLLGSGLAFFARRRMTR